MISCNQKIIEVVARILQTDDGTYERWLDCANKWLTFTAAGVLKSKFEAKDIVHSLIEKLYYCERNWDDFKYPDFNIYFLMLIRSHISDLAKYGMKFVDVDASNYDDEDNPAPSFFDNYNNVSKDELFAQKDFKEFEKLCEDALRDDHDACIVFNYLCDGHKNAGIAQTLGVSIDFVENAKKRIRRKLYPVYLQFFKDKCSSLHKDFNTISGVK